MASALHDIKTDLDGMPTELWSDLKQVVEDARPAAGSALKDVRGRGAAVGARLVDHLPDGVVDRVPDALSNHIPATTKRGSRGKKLLLLGGAAAAAVGFAAWTRRGAMPAARVADAYPRGAVRRNGRPVSMTDEALDLPVDDDDRL
jgi:hypothetical protein